MSGKDVTPKALTNTMEEKKESGNGSNMWMVSAIPLKSTLTKEPVDMGPVPFDYKVQRGETSTTVVATVTDNSEGNFTNRNGNSVDARNLHHNVTVSFAPAVR
uniref:WxL domain-containing protein n=1 Tax=Angiostrongylus cantonensis TaxID=6313 RepID=A0A0K0D3B4_ANGCA